MLSDHNVLTSVDGLNAVHGASEQFLLIKGEELSDRFGDKPIHDGVELLDYRVTPSAITITIKMELFSKYRVQFIGRNGRVLSEAISSPAVYEFKGDELYVRVKVLDSNGRLAWTQPVWRSR